MVNAAKDIYLENRLPALTFFLILPQMENVLDGNAHILHNSIPVDISEMLSNIP
jgi:hypothetical protein